MNSQEKQTKPIAEGHIVKFHTPMPDENPDQTYVVLEATETENEKRAKIRPLGTGLRFPGVTTVSANELIHAEVDASDLIGHHVTVETLKGKRISGKAVKVWNETVQAELTRISDGVDVNVYLTIEDESGDTHDGFLFVDPHS